MDIFEQLTKGKYGSLELQRYVGPNLIRGLIISVIIHSVAVGAPWIVTLFKGEEEVPERVLVLDPNILKKLKQLDPNMTKPKIARPKLAIPKLVVPVPVAKEDVPDEEQPEILKQEELQQAIIEEYADATDSLDFDPNADIVISEEIPDAGVFIPFEVAPQPLPDFSPQPGYPEIARQAQTRGKVIAQVYVDKEGVVKKWKIVKEEPENLGFKEEVEKVITKWKFTPAIQQGNPVGVWIAIPFTFRVK